MNIKLPILSLLISLLLILQGCNIFHEQKVLKLAHGMDQKHSIHIAMVYMGERLEELSGGKMKLDIYPGSQLGAETQRIELVQIGSLAMANASSAALEGFVEEYKVFGIPYLFRSKEHYFDVLDGAIGEEIKNSTEKYLFRGLGYYDAGARSFYTVENEIRKPEDLAGLKIRVMKSPVSVTMMQTLGGSATPISWPELYTALQSGVVDGAENNLPSFVTAHHHEVAKNFSMDEHTMLPDVLIISKVVWDKLTAEEKAWLEQSVQESIIFQRKLWEEHEKTALLEAEEKGVRFYHPDKKLFMDKVSAMRSMFKDNARVYDLILKIDRIAEEKETTE